LVYFTPTEKLYGLFAVKQAHWAGVFVGVGVGVFVGVGVEIQHSPIKV
jgi:hypothetical protein